VVGIDSSLAAPPPPEHRGKRWVNCWFTQVAVLYAGDANGQDIHPISANIEHEDAPWPLADGRVIYTRWEYVDRSRVSFHHLWTANPDGSNHLKRGRCSS
jgi:hypothetical protein